MYLNFHKWLELEITNNYFKSGVSPVFDLVPFYSSSKKMNNYDILENKKENLFSFFTGVNGQESFAIDKHFEGLNDLYFQLVIDDPLFFNYTDVPSDDDQNILYLKNGANSNNQSLLQQTQFVSKLDLIGYKLQTFNVELPYNQVNLEIKTASNQSIKTKNIDGTKVRNYLIDLNNQEDGVYELWMNEELKETFFYSSEELKSNCLGILHLDLRSIIAAYSNGIKYSLNFNARSVFLQYQVVIPKSRKIQVIDMSIVGAGNDNYEDPVLQQIIGEQTAQVFTTINPIQLKKWLEQTPELKVTYSNDFSNRRNQLDLKLPSPQVEQLKKYNQGKNKGLFFSSTIVYV